MRSDSHTSTVREPQLTPRRERTGAALVGGVLVLALFTGGATSPVAPLLIPLLVLLVRFATRPSYLAAPLACAAMLCIVTVVQRGWSITAVLVPVAVAAAGAAGAVWRREVRRTESRIALLDDILTQSERPVSARARAASEELTELERAVAAIVAQLGAREGTLWGVDMHTGVAYPRVTTGTRSAAPVRLSGDPLGWAWEQGMRLRLEPPPRWVDDGVQVVAEQLRRFDDAGDLVSYGFAPGVPVPADAALDQAAVYLRGVLALQEARAGAVERERRVAALLAGLRRMPGELELPRLLHDLVDTAAAVTDATGAVLGTWDGERGEVLAVTGADGGPQPGDRFELPMSELALAVRADTLLVRVASDWTPGRTAVANPDESWRQRPRCMAALPLHGPTSGVVGVIAVWSSRRRALDPASLELLHLMSPYAALHLEHARAFGRLRETAERDPLTGLRNRRAFDEAFTTEATRFERYNRPLALLLLDVDHFKAVNDRFGHEAGDEVLRRIARLVTASVRDTDTVGRFGGEEFVVLLPETSVAAATDVAERICAVVRELRVEWRGSQVPVRVSIGVSAAPERVPHPRELVGSADAALYRAKVGGRDRVVVA